VICLRVAGKLFYRRGPATVKLLFGIQNSKQSNSNSLALCLKKRPAFGLL